MHINECGAIVTPRQDSRSGFRLWFILDIDCRNVRDVTPSVTFGACVPFIEDLLNCTSGLVAGCHDSEEHTKCMPS